jgi:hypothetical protein
VTPAYNTRSPAEVDTVIEEARAAGARIAREPAESFWGGYSGWVQYRKRAAHRQIPVIELTQVTLVA